MQENPAAADSMDERTSRDVPDMTALREELIHLHSQIPAFAVWRISELERILWQYIGILHEVTAHTYYEQQCAPLLQSLPGISKNIRVTIETGHWSHFNMAATMLSWDVESLIGILAKG